MAEVLHHMAETDYRSAEGINWSKLKVGIYKTPAHMVGQEQKDSDALDYGKAFHTAILEPDDLKTHVVKGPATRRGKAWEQAKAEAGNAIVLVEADYDKLFKARDAIHANPDVARLINANNRSAEVSGFWYRAGIKSKCRWDLVVNDGETIVDVKTTVDASATGFAKAVANFGYHGQDAWYSSGAQECFGVWPRFLFIAVEKEPPFASAVYWLDAATRTEGKALADAAFDLFVKCQEAGEYPAYPPGIQQLSLPKWAYRLSNPNHLGLKGL